MKINACSYFETKKITRSRKCKVPPIEVGGARLYSYAFSRQAYSDPLAAYLWTVRAVFFNAGHFIIEAAGFANTDGRIRIR